MNNTYKKFFIIAVLLHALIFVSVALTFKPSSWGDPKSKFIEAHLYQPDSRDIQESKKQITTPESHPRKEILNKNDVLVRQSPQQKTRTNENKQASQPRQEEELSAGQKNKFFELIYRAISSKQVYPPDALFFKKKGTVILVFRMSPDGSISHAKVLKSAGFQSLDDEALKSLLAIHPFTKAKNYLKRSQLFTITIVFRL